MTYSVIVEKGWSYIIGPNKYRDGPWRYRWEAQENADALNARAKMLPKYQKYSVAKAITGLYGLL
jgi:hypothetical protein